MSGALILRGDALRLPLPDESVDLIVSSPPYFALRSYRDGGEHYSSQIGSEPTPQAFLEALWAVMAECWRVLKPTGSCFINLGDKRSGSGGHNNASLQAPGNKHAKAARSFMEQGRVIDPGHRNETTWTSANGAASSSRPSSASGAATSAQNDSQRSSRRNAPDRYNQAAFGRPKSKMLLPHRFAIGCEDGMADPEGKGWIMRSDIVWQKLNGLPESVADRCRDSHEYLFHFTKEGRYFAAVDEVRDGAPKEGRTDGVSRDRGWQAGEIAFNPLGKLPGSVWPLPSEPLIVSDEVKAHYDLPDHFAAFPTELVRRVILGWSPSGVCVECGEGRRPVVAKEIDPDRPPARQNIIPPNVTKAGNGHNGDGSSTWGHWMKTTITGYSCSCPALSKQGRTTIEAAGRGCPQILPPTRPSVVLDVFGGTGTTAGVARALGRIGVSVDLSHDYSRLADWRVHRSGHFAKVVNRTNRENQGDLFGVPA